MKSPTAELNDLIVEKYKDMLKVLRVEEDTTLVTFNYFRHHDGAVRWLKILKDVEFSTLTLQQRGNVFHPVLTWCTDSDILSEVLVEIL